MFTNEMIEAQEGIIDITDAQFAPVSSFYFFCVQNETLNFNASVPFNSCIQNIFCSFGITSHLGEGGGV